MKQAYLITAYDNFDHLGHLVRFLDGENIFFYICIDAKVDIPDSLYSLPTANKIEILHDTRVEWGDQSQIITELQLFERAFQNSGIEWFHLISGTDFPLKPAEEIARFYERATGVDCFMETEPLPAHLAERVEIYHFFVRRKSDMPRWMSTLLDKSRFLQVKLHLKRKHPACGPFMYGSNWVDLRRKAVAILLEEKDDIIKHTRHTSIANEIYKQTFLQNRGLSIVNDNLRYIDWSDRKPSPKSLTPGDFENIRSCNKLFARKFDTPAGHGLRDEIIANM